MFTNISMASVKEKAYMQSENIGAIQRQFERIHNLIVDFVRLCPDHLWEKVHGGYPIWQQVYHTFACYNHILCGVDEPPVAALFGEHEKHIMMLEVVPQALSREEVQAFATDIKREMDIFFAGITSDAFLQKKHEGQSAYFDKNVKHISLFFLLISHGYYHLGAFDVLLRDNGIEGLF